MRGSAVEGIIRLVASHGASHRSCHDDLDLSIMTLTLRRRHSDEFDPFVVPECTLGTTANYMDIS